MRTSLYSHASSPLGGNAALKTSGHIVNYLHLFALGAFAIAQPLFDLLGRNAEFFAARQSEPLDIALLALAVLLVPLPLVLLEFICGLSSPRFERTVHLLLITLLAALAILPLVKSVISSPALAVIGASIGIAALFALAYARQSVAYALVSWLAVAIVMFPLYFLVLSPASAIVFPANNIGATEGTIAPSKELLPIIVVVLDELPLTSLMTTEQEIDSVRYPNFARLAGSSTWYRNATTVASGTLRSLPSILTGVLPETKRQLATYAEFPNNLFTLLGPSYKLNVFESVTSLCPEHLCQSRKVAASERLASLFNDVALVYLHIIMPVSIAGELPDIRQNWGNFLAEGDQPGDKASGKVIWLRDIVGPWQAKTDKPDRFRQFGQSITAEPALNFIHLLFPHVPFRYLPSGKTYTNGLWAKHPDTGRDRDKWVHEWSAARNYQQSLLQLAYMDRLLGEFLDRLQSVGVYDDALIVLVSDHGASYRVGTNRRLLSRSNAPALLPVIMLVKEPGQREGKVSDRNVETIDILPTLAHVTGTVAHWNIDGQSMLDLSLTERKTKSAYSKTKKRLLTFDSNLEGKTAAVQYRTELLGQGEDPIVLYGPGLRSDLLGQPTADTRDSDKETTKVNLDDYPRYMAINLNDTELPVRLTGRIRKPADPTQSYDIAVSINGTIEAVGKTYPIGGNAEFSLLIPQSTLKAGKNKVHVFVPPQETD